MNPDDPMIRGNETAPRPDAAADGSGEDDIQPSSTPVANAGRVGTVLYEPEATFESVRQKPDWLIPLLLLLGIALAFNVLVQPKIDMGPYFEDMTDRMADRMGMSEEQRQAQLDQMLDSASGGQSILIVLISVPAVLAIVSLILWGSMRAAGGSSSFMQTFSVTLYSWMPQLIKSLVLMALMIPRTSVDMRFMGTILKSHPGAFVDPITSPVLSSALSWLEIFNIWTIVLLVIGLSVINRFSKAKVGVFVVLLYLIAAAIGVGLVILQQKFM